MTDTAQQIEELRRENEQLSRELRELKNELVVLRQANEDLDSFTYSVSHDLRAPLRAIDGFSRILVEDFEDLLGAEGERVISVIRKNSQKMSLLINELLRFSRLGRQNMETAEVDMTRLAHAAFAALVEEDEAPVEFECPDLPPARGDTAMLSQVWHNLLENALKYSIMRDKRVIHVGFVQQGDSTEYSVTDNGIGFDMRYADKLFGVFQRLHSDADFEGTGVGLAIVKRIVNKHGGAVRASAAPNEGATFCFTLPHFRSEDSSA